MDIAVLFVLRFKDEGAVTLTTEQRREQLELRKFLDDQSASQISAKLD